MLRSLLAATLCVAAGSAALAADLPMAPPPPPRAPATYVPAPIPYYNWTGFYIGGNLGGGFGGISLSDTAGSTFTSTTSQSFLGGAEVGFNWQWAGLVVGAEGDFEWLPNTKNTLTATAPGGVATATINDRWLTLADARVGYAWDRFLLFAKGGGAFAGQYNSSGTFQGTGTTFGISGPSTNSGWNVGFGAEWAFWGTWSAKAEYVFVRFNNAVLTASPTAPGPFANDAISTNNREISLVTLGLNYKFGPW
jgi:outer membrane immunogenic protein